MKNIEIPQSESAANITISIEKNIVIVGANGAGKTRLGSKIEQLNNPKKRISAQRYLQFNPVVQKQDFITALEQLEGSYRNANPAQPQSNYGEVMVSLFAEEARRNEKVINSIKNGHIIHSQTLQKSAKERVIEVWDFIFPYRKLNLEEDRVRAKSENSEFSAAEMSDGEKVGLYLISQVLLAKENCLVIVDEPELHLHKSLMVRLWNKLEEVRSDCTFVYITHDLDFAVNKPASKILWVQKFKNDIWKWVELDSNNVIPENLFLEVLGSRKPILFVEGEKGSLDAQIYQSYYQDFTVIPHGSCEKIIESVKGLRQNSYLHDKKIFGLIDRDYRSAEHLNSLKNDGVFNIELNEVENIFLIPEIIEMVCDYLGQNDKKEIIEFEIKKIYKINKDNVYFATVKYRIQRLLNENFGSVKTNDNYNSFKSEIFSKTDAEFSSVSVPLEDSNLIEILKSYPHKGLVSQVQGILSLNKNGYKNLVLNFFTTTKREEIIRILSQHLPVIE